ncbi:TVP38/TMEM64 family protein [Clostridium sporogenes]|uniref:TVP38/TMEM64 family protein n=1 Tax=Clostridium sporogenes TaxID=1509 RepID=UPI00214A8124|nr:TVP38/TMEM64 family protein [Clostridium sporogenes]EKS4342816.1 TVP38/TMEM64 family protein [Clostridium botulinum]EKS4393280.1 TVP38/TMEM64 family protein [Clostridium botulinum]MCR1974084.1 TVP38/TMEM64 family protein [Clostridium sporogenes]MCW6079197.1 TVP38/TMEM64 family protein [Clostridium sporogenes]
MEKSKKNIIVSIIFVVLLAFLVYFLRNTILAKDVSAVSIKEYVNSYGAIAPIIYIILFTLVPLTLFPDSILAIAGGMAFGMVEGSIYTIIGAVCGASLSFYIARVLGRNVVEKLVKGKGKWFEDGVEKNGFLVVFILRLIPLVPFDIISYGAGLSKIKFKDFILATTVGIIPGILVFINLGDKALNIKSKQFVISIVLLVLLCLVSFIMKKKLSFNKLQKDIIKKGDSYESKEKEEFNN